MRKVLAAVMAIVMVLSSSLVMAETIEVEENLLSVEITIPAEYFGEEDAQERCDEYVEEGKCKDATVNEDGSVTIVMSKKQHEEMLVETKAAVDEALVQMVETTEDASFVSIEANEDCTEFKVILSSDTVGFMESFSAYVLYMYGGIYAAYAGTDVENIAVVFINQATNEVIETYNSADMES